MSVVMVQTWGAHANLSRTRSIPEWESNEHFSTDFFSEVRYGSMEEQFGSYNARGAEGVA